MSVRRTLIAGGCGGKDNFLKYMLVAKNNFQNRFFREFNTEENGSVLLRFLKWAFGTAFQYELLEILYFIVRFFVYAYLAAIVLSFFFQSLVPKIIVQLLETFSEPYIGAIGIYFVLLGILHRRGKNIPLDAGEVFFVVWLLLLVVSSGFIYFSPEFHFDRTYNLIMKNSLAALVFRIGRFLK